MINLNLNHLFYFWKIAQIGTISGAAEEVNVSKSSLSTQMKLLEDKLETQLFSRKGRNIELTSEGKNLYKHCDEIFLKVSQLDRLILSDGLKSTGRTIKMATSYNISPYLKLLIQDFFESKGYELNFIHYDEKLVHESFQVKNYDFMLSSTMIESSLNEYTLDRITKSPYVVVKKPASILRDPLYMTMHIVRHEDAVAIRSELNRNQKSFIIQKIEIQNDLGMAKLLLKEKNQLLCTPEINIFNDLKEGKLQRLKTLNCFESQYLYTKNNKEMMKLKEELIEEVVRLMPSQLPANLVSG